jgi:hypothetical protein
VECILESLTCEVQSSQSQVLFGCIIGWYTPMHPFYRSLFAALAGTPCSLRMSVPRSRLPL